MNKKLFAIFILGIMLVSGGLSLVAQAQIQDYTVLAPLPGTTECGTDLSRTDCKTTLERYLPGLFNLAIGISAAFAVLMIVIGGFQYITTDAIQGKSEGKSRILNSLYGLLFVIAAWLILFTINPNLLTLNLNIESIEIKSTASGSLGPAPTSADLKCPIGECVPIPNGIAMTASGTTVNKAIAPELTTLDQELKKVGLTLRVSEAYPPSIHHQNVCHTTGMCIDAGKVPDDKVKTFVDTTWNKTGLWAQYEVESQARKDTILTASCGTSQSCKDALAPAIGVYPGKIKGEHFSVYKK